MKDSVKAEPDTYDLVIKASVPTPTADSFTQMISINFELTKNCEDGVFNTVVLQPPLKPLSAPQPSPIPITPGYTYVPTADQVGTTWQKVIVGDSVNGFNFRKIVNTDFVAMYQQ